MPVAWGKIFMSRNRNCFAKKHSSETPGIEMWQISHIFLDAGLCMKKVSLRELVADKIIFAILIAIYYWMWARNERKDYYTTIRMVVCLFTFYYFASCTMRVRKYKQEAPDERTERNLKRSAAAFLLIGFACAVGRFTLTTQGIGYALMGALILIAIVRTALFCVMDEKGL